VGDLEGKYTFAMTIDPDDNVWVPVNGEKNLYQIGPDETIVVHDSTTVEPLKYEINDLESDHAGNIWLATDGGGLVRIGVNGGYSQWTAASTGGLIPQDNLTHMEIRDNVIWASTSDSGIVRLADVIETSFVAVEEDDMAARMPKEMRLHHNYPNPFNPSTTIAFSLNRAENVKLNIYNLRGELIANLADGYFAPGRHEMTWDGSDMYGNPMATGLYFYQMTAGSERTTQKMMLVK
jgi:hypothetical protein